MLKYAPHVGVLRVYYLYVYSLMRIYIDDELIVFPVVYRHTFAKYS